MSMKWTVGETAIACLVSALAAGCASGPSEPWLDKQAAGDSVFYFHSTSGSIVIAVTSDALRYCSARGKSATLASRQPDGYDHFHSNYICR